MLAKVQSICFEILALDITNKRVDILMLANIKVNQMFQFE